MIALIRYYVYMAANGFCSVLYIGVTNDLVRRMGEHKPHLGSRFTTD